MKKQKDGFMGERSIVLPPMVVETEENDPLVSNLYLTDIGYYPHATHHYINRQKAIDQYVLIYCVDGSGWYRIDEKEYKVNKNQFFILPAGKPHTYGADEGNEWTIYWIHFKGYIASIYAEGAQKPQEINITTTSRVSERHNIFEEIFHTLELGQDIESLRYASSVLHHYLASMRYLRTFRRAVKNEDNANVIDAAIHYMEENIERRISIQDVVKYVGYSASRFATLFKQQTGKTPLNYFNQLKIQRSCSLLKNTDMKINQICYKIGIDDSLYFSRLFSKIMGMSPRDYREGLRSFHGSSRHLVTTRVCQSIT